MTGLLLKLLGAHVEDAGHIAKASLAFRGGVGAGWFVFLLLLLGGIIYGMYRTNPTNLSPARTYGLIGCRVLFIGLILMLLIQA